MNTSVTKFAEISYDVEGAVGLITLSRPDSLNAWTPTMNDEIRRAVELAVDDQRVVGIVLTGAGRGFCAGADMSAVSTASDDGTGTPHAELPDPCGYFLSVPKPMVAAINGAAAGMGLAIAMACDLRFMSTSAVLTTSFAHRGLAAEFGMSWILPRLVGPAVAMDLLLTARKVSGDEARSLGLVNRTVEPGALLDEAMQFVEQLAASSSPHSMANIKAQVYADMDSSPAESFERAAGLVPVSHAHADFAEGIASYMERRAPRFERIGSGVTIVPTA